MKNTSTAFIGIAILSALMLVGCQSPNIPDIVTVDTSQTAFLIPLEGDTNGQGKAPSEEFYSKAKVFSKRITITKRWRSTGYGPTNGQWIPEQRLVVVERKPETREWVAANGDHHSGGIKAESKESIDFVTGMNITAQIDESDAAKFLYRYGGKPLKDIIDDEIRARIEGHFSEGVSHYSLDEALLKKSEIMEDIRKEVIPYFKERGITITVLGMKGGFTYLDPKIQESINAKFTAEQQKIAQLDKNLQTVSKAEADAKAAAIMSDPRVVQLKQFELTGKWIDVMHEKWKGDYPSTLIVNGAGQGQSPFNMMFQMPATASGK